MADGRNIEYHFWLYLGAILADQREIWIEDEESHADIDSRWRTAAILKIALSPYLSCELSDFHQIWYADAYFNSQDGHLTKKIEILQNQDGGRVRY